MNVPFLVSNILSGVGMCAMLASTTLRSRRKILAVQSVNHALSMAACSLLRGWSGAVQEAVNLVRDLAILQFGKLNRFWQISFVAAGLLKFPESCAIPSHQVAFSCQGVFSMSRIAAGSAERRSSGRSRPERSGR